MATRSRGGSSRKDASPQRFLPNNLCYDPCKRNLNEIHASSCIDLDPGYRMPSEPVTLTLRLPKVLRSVRVSRANKGLDE